MVRFHTFVLTILLAFSSAQAGLVWESTFDSGSDGVVDLRTDNPNGTVMIGANTGGALTLTMESLVTTLSNKAGRSLGTTHDGIGDTFSGLYAFSFSRLEGAPGTAGIEGLMGFTSGSSTHNTRQFMGISLHRTVESNGTHTFALTGRFGSNGNTGSGRIFAPSINLGNDAALLGRPLLLAIGYDGTTLDDERLKISLHDGVTGALLTEINRTEMGGLGAEDCGGVTGCPIRWANNLFGAPNPTSPALQLEIEQFALQNLGFTDFLAGINDVETDVDIDSLSYFDDFNGAFDAIGPAGACCQIDGSCDTTSGFNCGFDFQGEGTDCGSANCTPSVGACCSPDATCANTTRAACADDWQGPNTNCGSTVCIGVGACCHPDGTCTDGDQASCTGAYQGDGTECATANCPQPDFGACCHPDGSCTEESVLDCQDDFQGDGITCATANCPQPPVAACCHPDSSCTSETVFDCTGNWQGEGTDCGTTNCLTTPTGACCSADGTCADDVTEADCCGDWQGDGTTCAGSNCVGTLSLPVWRSTFDVGADGVVDLRTVNHPTVMIGGNTGGAQTITTESLFSTPSNKAGRALGTSEGGTDSFSALYDFNWSRLEGDPGAAGIEGYAGFTSGNSTHSTRMMMGASLNRAVLGNGDHEVALIGRFASVGFVGSGRIFSRAVNLGPDLEGRPMRLAIGYDGSTLNDERMRISLHDGATGELLSEINRTEMGGIAVEDCGGATGCPVRWANNIFGAPMPTDPKIQQEIDAMAYTHLGFTDFVAGIGNIETDWSVTSMTYYDSYTGAFDAVEAEPCGACCAINAVCTQGTGEACNGVFQGPATTCAGVSCPFIQADPIFDRDLDGDVDTTDHGAIQKCRTIGGPTSTVAPECLQLDVDGDDDIDDDDIRRFRACADTSGPAIPADVTCDDLQACCKSDSSCEDLVAGVCEDPDGINGTAQGLGTECGSTVCP